jgi:hypothetical protein
MTVSIVWVVIVKAPRWLTFFSSLKPRSGIVFKDISTELPGQVNWPLAEKAGLKIPQIALRHKCWKEIEKKIPV